MLGLVVSGDGSAPILLTDRLVEEDSSYIDSFWKLLMNFDLASRAGAWRRWDADDHLGLYKDLCSPFFCRTSPMVHVCVWVFFCMNFGTKTGGLFKSIDWHPSISRPMYAIAFLLLSWQPLFLSYFCDELLALLLDSVVIERSLLYLFSFFSEQEGREE